MYFSNVSMVSRRVAAPPTRFGASSGLRANWAKSARS
jgi:hypothetical protein